VYQHSQKKSLRHIFFPNQKVLMQASICLKRRYRLHSVLVKLTIKRIYAHCPRTRQAGSSSDLHCVSSRSPVTPVEEIL
jgi:hypothetical protein